MPVLYKYFGRVIYRFRSKLAYLSKLECLRQTINKTIAYYDVSPFVLHYRFIKFYRTGSRSLGRQIFRRHNFCRLVDDDGHLFVRRSNVGRPNGF